MQLISILGATSVNDDIQHTYHFDQHTVQGKITVSALIQVYSFDRVVLLSTEAAFNTHHKVISAMESKGVKIEFEPIDQGASLEDIILKIEKYIAPKTVLDLTQGFRNLQMVALIQAIQWRFAGSDYIEDAVYAQIITPKNPSDESCEYRFLRLNQYIDVAYIATVLRIFSDDYAVIHRYKINDAALKSLANNLEKFSKAILRGYLFNAIRYSNDVIASIDKVKQQMHLGKIGKYVMGLLDAIKSDMTEYREWGTIPIFQQLYRFANKMKHKGFDSLAVRALKECIDELLLEYAAHKCSLQVPLKSGLRYELRKNIARYFEGNKLDEAEKALGRSLNTIKMHELKDHSFQKFLSRLRDKRNVSAHISVREGDAHLDDLDQIFEDAQFYVNLLSKGVGA